MPSGQGIFHRRSMRIDVRIASNDRLLDTFVKLLQLEEEATTAAEGAKVAKVTF